MRNLRGVQGGFIAAAALLAGLLIPTSGAAQPFLAVHGERWSLDSGHLGAAEVRAGVGLEVGSADGGGSTGFLASWVPEGGVEPRWLGERPRSWRPGLSLALD